MSVSVENIKPLDPDVAKCPEITHEKSQAVAMQIRILNTFVFALDEEYLTEAIKQSESQHSMYDATAVLNRSWTREQSDLLGEQVNALQHLLNYIKSNKRITELRERLHNATEIQQRFQKQFPV